MSVWDDIDRLRAKHEREARRTAEALEGEFGRAIKGSLTVDDYGNWCCRYIPAGERRQEVLRARTSSDLVEALFDIRKAEFRKKGAP